MKNHPLEPETIGPVLDLPGGVIYHVTLPSGAIVTSPAGFGDWDLAAGPVVAEDGTVLVHPAAPSHRDNGNNGRDERLKIDADPEDALRALLKPRGP